MKKILIGLFLFFTTTHVAAQTVYDAHTTVELVSKNQSLRPGESTQLGLLMRMDPDWHVYWINPGDSGLPPKINWQLPEGVRAGPLQWPYPTHINVGPLTSYGYENQILFPISFETDESLPITTAAITAHVSWLACKVDCIPGQATLHLTLPVSSQTPTVNPVHGSIFDETQKKLPVHDPLRTPSTRADQSSIRLIFKQMPDDNIYFFPERSDLIQHAAPQKVELRKNEFHLVIPKSNLFPSDVERLRGVLVSRNARAIAVDIPIVTAPVAPNSDLNLIIACIFALIGGLILNLMPCVLPVLSLKILNLVTHNSSRLESLRHGFAFAAGIISSFWILAGVLILLKTAGQNIGWGFQFQSPAFVAFMAAMLFVLSLNLFGVLEWNIFFTRRAPQGKGYAASFWGGVLTTVLATPCTAPFMGAALGYALTQPALSALLIFSCLGLGMAMPYLILSANPELLKWVPKPGPWMVKLKRFFGVVMILCAAWLLWVLSLQTGLYRPSHMKENGGILWEEFSAEKLRELQSGTQPIFIDFTAAWCLTCQVNERTVLQHPGVVQKFQELSVIALKADWTNHNPDITAALAGYGKNSIPLYVYYPTPQSQPIILPELITPAIMTRIFTNPSAKEIHK